ncbi:MAG: hypothetical protein ACKO5X_05505 [Limnohabitans sp.]
MNLTMGSWHVSVLGLSLVVFSFTPAWGHDSITTEIRQRFMQSLQQSQTVLTSSASLADKSRAHFHIATTLDSIRDLFNEDIQSHGAVYGLESTALLAELSRAGFSLRKSESIGTYLSPLQHYRLALELDPKSAHATELKYRLFKNQFYDSFTDNPLKPITQTREELIQLLQIGEILLKSKEPVVRHEEVHFIQAIHTLQAIDQQLLSATEGRKKFKQLLTGLRNNYPHSLKVLTLEALGASY